MPILVIFLLTAACLPVEWPNPLGLGPWAAAGLTAACLAVPLAAAFALRTWTLRSLRRAPDRRVSIGHRHDRIRRGLFLLNVGAVAAAVVGLGWGAAVWDTLLVRWEGEELLAPFVELLVPLPYFLVVFGCWLIYYDVERALHRPTTDPPSEVRYWSRAGYFFHNLRQLALFVFLPVGLIVSQLTLARFLPEVARDELFRGLTLAAMPVVLVLLPLFIKPLLGLRSMPPGPARERIEAVARRLHFRYADLLIWPTHDSVTNAMIVGLLPRVRYVIFTDGILEEMPPDELDAVFGHEAGHALHGHIWFYGLFLILSAALVGGAFLLVGQRQDAIMWVAFAAYFFVVFGFLSRRCERQADIFGCRAVSCADPNCCGHNETTVYPERGSGLCPTGIRTCARALERVGAIAGHGGPDGDGRWSVGMLLRGVFGWLRAWQHSTLPRRVKFLLSLIDDRERERRFQRRVWLVRWGLAVGLIAAVAALGQTVGWGKLLEVM